LPAAQSPPWFDAVGQRTVLPLQDALGRTLALQIPHSASGVGTAERLKAVAALATLEVAFVEIVPVSDGFLPVPLSVGVRQTPGPVLQPRLLGPGLPSSKSPEAVAGGGVGCAPPAEPSIKVASLALPPHGHLTNEIRDGLLARSELGLVAPSADA